MVRAVLWSEGTLRGRIGRGFAIGLELNAIPLHISLEWTHPPGAFRGR